MVYELTAQVIHLLADCDLKIKNGKAVEELHGFDRSRISPDFAKNFIELFLEE